MVLAHKEFDATDEAGNLLLNVQASVELEGGGLISIYADRAGTVPLANPATFLDGHVSFFSLSGALKITLTQGAYTRVLRYVAIGLMQEADGDTTKLPLDGSEPLVGALDFTHQISPSNPAAGLLSLFAKSDDKLYTLNSDGVEIGLGSGDVIEVATRTALKALDTTKDTSAILTEPGREGLFLWHSGDYSTQITADTLEGIYVKATAIASTAGAWVRVFDGPMDVRWFGAKNDNSADAKPAVQAAVDLAEVIGAATTEGPVGSIYMPAGEYLFDSSVAFTVSANFKNDGYVNYTPTTGAAFIVGDALNNQNTFYALDFGCIRATNGNGSIPTSINGSGSSAVEVRRVQFSRIRVRQAIAFTKYGIWLNSSNDQFTGQHIQDNDFTIDEAAYCGAGVFAESVSAADGACQVNRIYIGNAFSNFRDVELGEAGDINTNHNIVTIDALDAPGAGGSELRVFGSYNMITLGFVDTNGIVSFESGSVSNVIEIGRNAANVTYSDAGTANRALFADGVKRGLERYRTTGTGAEPLALESTDAGATFAQLLELYRNSGSPAANDGGVGIVGYFNDAAGNKTQGFRIRTDMPTVADGNENLRLLFDTIVGGSLANRMILWQGLSLGGGSADQGAGTVNVDTGYYKSNTKVVGARVTGWGAATGTATRTTFATGSVTTAQLAERVKALIDDLIAHGLIGA